MLKTPSTSAVTTLAKSSLHAAPLVNALIKTTLATQRPNKPIGLGEHLCIVGKTGPFFASGIATSHILMYVWRLYFYVQNVVFAADFLTNYTGRG